MEIPRKYELQTYLSPIFDSHIVYHESVLFIEGEDTAPLLFPADEILAVFSADLTVEYKKGTDWTLDKGSLVRLPHSGIPQITLAEYYPSEHRDGMDFGCTVPGRPFIRFGEGDTFIGRQAAVTYRHSGTWGGRVPVCQDKFRRFREKLTSGQPVRVVFYGDSITVGANSSGFIGVPPHAPVWAEMVTEGLKLRSGNDAVEYINTAVGGMNASWGLENIAERVIAHRPDLLVLGFGMNDAHISPDEFIELTVKMVREVQRACPECDIALVATMLPHDKVTGFFGNQLLFEPLLEAFAAEEDSVGVIPMTSIHRHLLTRKPYHHMTGNNVNHPNDFLARIYAMCALGTILG
ncbi:MAG: SGNH/GDSL hydrolase family protein [Ruminococcaceae bacterium]|nr:SGNH/GDSL hydrolase family protein [Oscillospiraceae bacterium]